MAPYIMADWSVLSSSTRLGKSADIYDGPHTFFDLDLPYWQTEGYRVGFGHHGIIQPMCASRVCQALRLTREPKLTRGVATKTRCRHGHEISGGACYRFGYRSGDRIDGARMAQQCDPCSVRRRARQRSYRGCCPPFVWRVACTTDRTQPREAAPNRRACSPSCFKEFDEMAQVYTAEDDRTQSQG